MTAVLPPKMYLMPSLVFCNKLAPQRLEFCQHQRVAGNFKYQLLTSFENHSCGPSTNVQLYDLTWYQ